MKKRLELASSSWDEKEINAMHEVIDSGNLSMGKRVSEFEGKFSEFVNSKFSVMVNSGSSANLLMVGALFYKKKNGLKRGDEVIVPAVSWSTTYFPIHQYGLKLKFVDIDRKTLNYDLDQLRNSITSKTKVIMAVNILGNPNEFNRIKSLIKDTNIYLIEDNCESLGAKFEGQYTGTFGIAGTYSSYFSHHISTMEGGIITTNDEEIYHILLSLRSHGWTRNLPKNNHVSGRKSDDKFNESFKFVLPGYNLRPLEISAAVGIKQLDKLPKLIKQRRSNAEFIREIISKSKTLNMQEEIGESSWFGFALIIKENSNLTRKELVKKLDNIYFEYRPVVTGNFTRQPVCKYLGKVNKKNMINADYIDKNALYIGNHHFDLKEILNDLKNIV